MFLFLSQRNRKQLFESLEFIKFRDYVLDVMNRGVLEKLEESYEVRAGGEGI